MTETRARAAQPEDKKLSPDARMVMKRLGKACAAYTSECEGARRGLAIVPCGQGCHCFMIAAAVCEELYSLADDWGPEGWERIRNTMHEAAEHGGYDTE